MSEEIETSSTLYALTRYSGGVGIGPMLQITDARGGYCQLPVTCLHRLVADVFRVALEELARKQLDEVGRAPA